MNTKTNIVEVTCEKCRHWYMKESIFNQVPASGYSALLKYTCPECDYSYIKVR